MKKTLRNLLLLPLATITTNQNASASAMMPENPKDNIREITVPQPVEGGSFVNNNNINNNNINKNEVSNGVLKSRLNQKNLQYVLSELKDCKISTEGYDAAKNSLDKIAALKDLKEEYINYCARHKCNQGDLPDKIDEILVELGKELQKEGSYMKENMDFGTNSRINENLSKSNTMNFNMDNSTMTTIPNFDKINPEQYTNAMNNFKRTTARKKHLNTYNAKNETQIFDNNINNNNINKGEESNDVPRLRLNQKNLQYVLSELKDCKISTEGYDAAKNSLDKIAALKGLKEEYINYCARHKCNQGDLPDKIDEILVELGKELQKEGSYMKENMDFGTNSRINENLSKSNTMNFNMDNSTMTTIPNFDKINPEQYTNAMNNFKRTTARKRHPNTYNSDFGQNVKTQIFDNNINNNNKMKSNIDNITNSMNMNINSFDYNMINPGPYTSQIEPGQNIDLLRSGTNVSMARTMVNKKLNAKNTYTDPKVNTISQNPKETRYANYDNKNTSYNLINSKEIGKGRNKGAFLTQSFLKMFQESCGKALDELQSNGASAEDWKLLEAALSRSENYIPDIDNNLSTKIINKGEESNGVLKSRLNQKNLQYVLSELKDCKISTEGYDAAKNSLDKIAALKDLKEEYINYCARHKCNQGDLPDKIDEILVELGKELQKEGSYMKENMDFETNSRINEDLSKSNTMNLNMDNSTTTTIPNFDKINPEQYTNAMNNFKRTTARKRHPNTYFSGFEQNAKNETQIFDNNTNNIHKKEESNDVLKSRLNQKNLQYVLSELKDCEISTEEYETAKNSLDKIAALKDLKEEYKDYCAKHGYNQGDLLSKIDQILGELGGD